MPLCLSSASSFGLRPINATKLSIASRDDPLEIIFSNNSLPTLLLSIPSCSKRENTSEDKISAHL